MPQCRATSAPAEAGQAEGPVLAGPPHSPNASLEKSWPCRPLGARNTKIICSTIPPDGENPSDDLPVAAFRVRPFNEGAAQRFHRRGVASATAGCRLPDAPPADDAAGLWSGLGMGSGCQHDPRRYIAPSPLRRRGGRVAEGARLESVYTGNRIVGSNTTPYASVTQ